jgi:hypothetical protein
MNRVAVVGARSGGVAYSKERVIPWQKRVAYKQKGGGFDMSPGGWFATKGRRQKGGGGTGYYGKRLGDMMTGRRKPQKGGFSRVIARMERGRKRPQKGGGFFDDLGESMFGVKKRKGKRKRKPAVIHSAGRKSYSQKGVAKKQQGGLFGLGRLKKWQQGRSKEQRKKDDAWAKKNL